MVDMACYHHPSQNAVAQCACCGKSICKGCYEMYCVSSGEYAGQALCYDCMTQLVTRNVAEVEAFKNAKPSLGQLIFGEGKGAVRAMGDILDGGSNLASGSSGGFFQAMKGFIMIVISPIKIIVKISIRLLQMKRLNEIIASDALAFQEMQDYFAYTQVMEREASKADLASLVDKGGSLYENIYARAVLDKGEKAAQTELRTSIIQITANREIIRGFNSKEKSRKGKKTA